MQCSIPAESTGDQWLPVKASLLAAQESVRFPFFGRAQSGRDERLGIARYLSAAEARYWLLPEVARERRGANERKLGAQVANLSLLVMRRA